MRARSIFSLPLLFLLPACSGDAPSAVDGREVVRSAEVGERFDLSVGERARVGGGALTIGFRGVREDSRCATDVQCVWVGDAAVALTVALGDAGPRTLTLHTTLVPRAGSTGHFTITVEGLRPEPVSTRRIDPDAYVVTLLVESATVTTGR